MALPVFVCVRQRGEAAAQDTETKDKQRTFSQVLEC